MNIISAKYLYDEDGVTKTRVQLDLGNNVKKHIVIDESRESYQEIMKLVEEGTLTIEEAQ
jgi:predicted DNA-binding antitoxin AbrB/MazE fold protein